MQLSSDWYECRRQVELKHEPIAEVPSAIGSMITSPTGAIHSSVDACCLNSLPATDAQFAVSLARRLKLGSAVTKGAGHLGLNQRLHPDPLHCTETLHSPAGQASSPAQHAVVVAQVPLSQASHTQAAQVQSPSLQQSQPISHSPHGQVTADFANAISALGRSTRPLETPTTNIDKTIAIDLNISVFSR